MVDITDKNVENVISQMRTRVNHGFNKYQTTTERDDLSLLEWVQHAQEEAMDLAVYLEKIKSLIKDQNNADVERSS